MRDPERIPKVLGRIQEFWEKHPDLRLGQLLVSVLRYDRSASMPVGAVSASLIFYSEDERLMERIDSFEEYLQSIADAEADHEPRPDEVHPGE